MGGHLKFNISQHGDSLEKKYFESIIQVQLPAYQQIWENYIGNDGTNHLPSLDEDQNNFSQYRKAFSELHYSIFVSIVCCYDIIEEYKSLSSKGFLDIDLQSTIALISFIANIGREHDLYKKLVELVKLDFLYKSSNLDDFYKKRNNLIHGKKIPFLKIYEQYVIPNVEGKETEINLWNDGCFWEDFKKKEPINLIDFMLETYNSLLNELNDNLYSLYSNLKDKYNVKIKYSPNGTNYYDKGHSGYAGDHEDVKTSSTSGLDGSSRIL
jgi:hypothetical protein